MDYPSPRGSSAFESIEQVTFGIPHVDDDGQIELVGGFDPL
jgi:hypothetical protein